MTSQSPIIKLRRVRNVYIVGIKKLYCPLRQLTALSLSEAFLIINSVL